MLVFYIAKWFHKYQLISQLHWIWHLQIKTGFDRYLDCDLTLMYWYFLTLDVMHRNHSWHWLCGKLTFSDRRQGQGSPKERFRQNPNWPFLNKTSNLLASTQMRQASQQQQSFVKTQMRPATATFRRNTEHKISGWSRIHKFHHNPNWPNQPTSLSASSQDSTHMRRGRR